MGDIEMFLTFSGVKIQRVRRANVQWV